MHVFSSEPAPSKSHTIYPIFGRNSHLSIDYLNNLLVLFLSNMPCPSFWFCTLFLKLLTLPLGEGAERMWGGWGKTFLFSVNRWWHLQTALSLISHAGAWQLLPREAFIDKNRTWFARKNVMNQTFIDTHRAPQPRWLRGAHVFLHSSFIIHH